MYVENGEWKLTKTKVLRNNIVYRCCPEPYYDVTFVLYLERRILYFLYHVIYPCIMMSALTLLVFRLPPDSGEKIALGITVLLAFSVLMLSIAEKLPETSESVPLISIYLTTVMSMTSVSVIMTVFVLNLHHRSPRQKRVPDWLKTLMKFTHTSTPAASTGPPAVPTTTTTALESPPLHNNNRRRKVGQGPTTPSTTNLRNIEAIIRSINIKLRRVNPRANPLFTGKFRQFSNNSSNNNSKDGSKMAPQVPHISLSAFPGRSTEQADIVMLEEALIVTPRDRDPIYPNHYHCSSLAGSGEDCYYRQPTATSIQITDPNSPILDDEQVLGFTQSPAPVKVDKAMSTMPLPLTPEMDWFSNKQQEINENILQALKKVLFRYDNDECSTCIVYEWRAVAKFVDHILFWVYLVSTLVSTLIILVIAPAFRIIPLNIYDPEEINMNLTSPINFNDTLT